MEKAEVSKKFVYWLIVGFLLGLAVLFVDTNKSVFSGNQHVVLTVLEVCRCLHHILTLILLLVLFRKAFVPLVYNVLTICFGGIQWLVYLCLDRVGWHHSEGLFVWHGLESLVMLLFFVLPYIGVFLVISFILFVIHRRRMRKRKTG